MVKAPAKKGRPEGTGRYQQLKEAHDVWQNRALIAEARIGDTERHCTRMIDDMQVKVDAANQHKRRADILETAFIGTVRALALTAK